MRNERYNTATKQKQLSVKSAKHKAKEFAAKDDKSTRVLAKQAILKELNTQLIVKAEGIAPQNRKTREKTANDTEYPKSSKKKGEEQKPIINLASKIPRRIHGATAMALNQKRNEPILLQDCKASYSEAAMGVKNGEIFTENRERYQCLAEKYVLIWKKKTFGRVTPDLARKHHERKLKKHTLELWQDIWWTGRKGWKLNVRADYHNRYRLWQKAWRSWREYMKYCQVKKAKEKLAHQNAHHTVLMKCWAAWRKYIRTRRGKRRLTDRAMNFAQIQLKRRVWRQWLAQLELRRNLHYMDREALEFWANNLIGKVWGVWLAKLDIKTKEKEKMKMASKFYDQILVLKAWRGMKNFRSIRRLAQLRHDAARRHFSSMLLQKSFTLWVVRWQRQTELSQFEDLISFKGNMAVARRAFVSWKYYIALKHAKYNKEDLAVRHYRQHLLKTCLKALHLQAVHRRLKDMRLKLAEDLFQRHQLRRVWDVWLKKCEHSEELKLHPLSRKARSHYRFQLRRKLFAVWVKYCQWRKFRKSQYAIAEYHFRERALPRYLCQIMLFVDLMHSNKERSSAAEKFRREALQAKMFYMWWKKYHLTMDIRMMERMAILHNDEVIKRRCLRRWLQRALEKLRERELEAAADSHHKQRLLAMGIARWREFNSEMKDSRRVQRSSLRHYYIHLLKRTWTAWKEFVHQRQVKWQKQARVDLHYKQRLLAIVMSAWKDHHNKFKAADAHCREKLQWHNLNRLRFAFYVWKQNAKESKEKRQKKHIAESYCNQVLLTKCFSCWRVFATEHAVTKWQQWQRVHEIQETLEKGKLYRSFRGWTALTRRSVYLKNLKHKADCHRNKALLQRSLLTWKSYVHLCFRIKILQRQSMWLHNRRITAAFFRRWKKQHNIAVQEKRQTVLALWYWSVALQRKAFYAILEYAISRKRKAVRVSRALEERRNRLLRSAVTRWMKVGFHLAAERSRLAQERQLEVAHSVQQCVYRCAVHWRRITAKRVRDRGGKPRPRPVIEEKSDRPFPRVSCPINPVPSTQPAAYSVAVDRIISEAFKERPPPRKPDYLRESFDLSKMAIASSQTHSAQNTLGTTVEEDDTKPRPPPPLPCYQSGSNVHPHQRNPREESFVFPSSSGDESSLVTETTGEAKIYTHDSTKTAIGKKRSDSNGLVAKPVEITTDKLFDDTKQRRGVIKKHVLLPPSSFMLPSRSNRLPTKESFREGVVLHDFNSTHPASTPRTSLDSQNISTLSPGASTLSRGSQEEDDEGCDEKGEGTGADLEQLDGELGNEQSEPKKTTEEDVSHDLLVQRMEEGNLHSRIAAMKNTLLEFHDLKRTYFHKKRQRDQLFVWVQGQREKLGPHYEDEELLQTEHCMDELTKEVNEMSERIKQTRPFVEEVAVTIRELIEKTGLK